MTVYCSQCGAANTGQAAFCVQCGAQLAHAGQTQVPPMPAVAPPPMPAVTPPPAAVPNTAVPDSAGQLAAPPVLPTSAGTGKAHGNVLWIGVVAALTVVAVFVLCFTYHNEMWGGTSVPDPATLASVADGESAKADEVMAQLKGKGLKSRKKTVFHAEPVGTYVQMEGARPGERVGGNTEIVVVESAGPGVPKGTVGTEENKAVESLKAMGVPVSRTEVVVSSKSQVKEGEVAATFPSDGTVLKTVDADTGIVVGVAADKHGVGIDLLGQDKEQAKKILEDEGFKVTLRPHFSSKEHVGKMISSNPQPGVPVAKDLTDVTLYYGVDASKTKELFTQKTKHDADGWIAFPGDFMAGRYCRSDGTSCLDFEMRSSDTVNYGNALYELSDRDVSYGDGSGKRQHEGHYLTTSGGADITPKKAPGKESKSSRLIDTDSGAFDLYPHYSYRTATCATSRYTLHGAEYASYQLGAALQNRPPQGLGGVTYPNACINGDLKSMMTKELEDEMGPKNEMTFDMERYYVYFPVGSDMKSVESLGYFADDALQQAASEEQVDDSKPFVLMRDPSLYESTTKLYKDVEEEVGRNPDMNPFSAMLLNDSGTGLRKGKVQFKPAPSHETAYYLDEDSLNPGWALHAQAVADDESQQQRQRPDNWNDLQKQFKDGDYSYAAGTYCDKKWNTCMTLSDDGSLLTTYGSVIDVRFHPDGLNTHVYNMKEDANASCDFMQNPDPDDFGWADYCPTYARVDPVYLMYYSGFNESAIPKNLKGKISQDTQFLVPVFFPASSWGEEAIFYLQN